MFIKQTLYLTCVESFGDRYKENPILQEGVTVQIGMGKNTKLGAVFARYATVVSEHGTAITADQLEFVHCQLLSPHDTAEAAALMKNDRISVRREQSQARQGDQERERMQRESDKAYFTHMLALMKIQPDVVLDCRGVVREEGRVQQVLSSRVRCHAAIVKKRCPWLWNKIEAARDQRQAIVERSQARSGDEDDVMPLEEQPRPAVGRLAAEIEDDDEGGGGFLDGSPQDDNLLTVVVENHSPDAIKILLEYLYTNRVIPFGLEAFLQSCRTKPGHKHHGPVAPFPTTGSNSFRRWPNRGEPTITFGVALAAIVLAEEAGLKRLSLMAEVAAAELVLPGNFVDALDLCEVQKMATGNPLPRLRRAAMDFVLRSGAARGPFSLPSFRRALEEKKSSLIPTLLTGVMEAVEEERNKNIRTPSMFLDDDGSIDWQRKAAKYFRFLDRQDTFKREEERRKRRLEREGEQKESDSDRALRRNNGMKRMAHHLGGRMGSAVSSMQIRRTGGKRS